MEAWFCQCEIMVVLRWRNSQEWFKTVGFLPRFRTFWGKFLRFFYRLDKMESLVKRGFSQMLHRGLSSFSPFFTISHARPPIPCGHGRACGPPLQRGICVYTLLRIVGISTLLQRGIYMYSLLSILLIMHMLQRGICVLAVNIICSLLNSLDLSLLYYLLYVLDVPVLL